ncbi:MAG TPA: GAF domain-containing protein [Ramlibacter sp.]|jgi:GAF domain-containing protein|uniref:GAF domain-containing protein n=1 Tax=Ramlibacter sp. TaxID=1917967 RepID=UPI002D5AADCD|nr:GAF domain-containing protein [Ramlibacter sp.]HZY17841.1 GAF domain-containing protein [Ramlibacter sp.]
MVQEHPDRPDGLDDAQERFAVATSEGASEARLSTLSQLLDKVRVQLKMDVVFVSQFSAGRRFFRHVRRGPGEPETVAVGGSDALEESYCQRVVDGRLPQVIRSGRGHPVATLLPATHAVGVGGHLSVPIVMPDGSVFGTVCCFSHRDMPWLSDRDADTLRGIAKLIAAHVKRHGHI